MRKKSQSEFKMRMDNGETEALFAEERSDLRLEKLTQKVTIISILLPVLIGVILIISYLDIKTRVSTVQDTGESGVQSLSQNLESRFSSLSVKYAALEEAFNQKNKQMDKAQLSLQKRLKEAEKSVRWLNKIKAGKKTLEEKRATLDTRLGAIKTDLQTLDSNLSSLDQAVKQELAELVALVEKSGNAVLGFQAQVAEKIDRAEAEKLIDKQKKALLTSIEAMGLRLEKQIVLNRQKIAAVKDKAVVKKSTSKAASAPKKTPAPKPAPKQAEKPAQSAPQPGEIVEQDL
jgi:chromosome segregation ATPase